MCPETLGCALGQTSNNTLDSSETSRVWFNSYFQKSDERVFCEPQNALFWELFTIKLNWTLYNPELSVNLLATWIWMWVDLPSLCEWSPGVALHLFLLLQLCADETQECEKMQLQGGHEISKFYIRDQWLDYLHSSTKYEDLNISSL